MVDTFLNRMTRQHNLFKEIHHYLLCINFTDKPFATSAAPDICVHQLKSGGDNSSFASFLQPSLVAALLHETFFYTENYCDVFFFCSTQLIINNHVIFIQRFALKH